MAAPSKLPDNAPGKYYVTDDCNGCGRCFCVAIQNFMYTNDSSAYFIIQQPVDSREEDDIKEAISICMMDCIHSDGVA